MICRLTGRIAEISELAALVEVNGICYEVLVPSAALAGLQSLVGTEITIHTLQYLEGNPAGSHFTPRLIGFLNPADRELYNALIRVKGISMRKALRVMSLPTNQLAAAIERGDVAVLTGLPEIGKKTAQQICNELGGKLTHLAQTSESAPPVARELSESQLMAAEIIVQWGDRRADAQRWIAAAVEADPSLEAPEDIVRAAYQMKHRVR